MSKIGLWIVANDIPFHSMIVAKDLCALPIEKRGQAELFANVRHVTRTSKKSAMIRPPRDTAGTVMDAWVSSIHLL